MFLQMQFHFHLTTVTAKYLLELFRWPTDEQSHQLLCSSTQFFEICYRFWIQILEINKNSSILLFWNHIRSVRLIILQLNFLPTSNLFLVFHLSSFMPLSKAVADFIVQYSIYQKWFHYTDIEVNHQQNFCCTKNINW